MTRQELIAHMRDTHQIPESHSYRGTPLLIQDHAADHESVISIERGLANHRHSEYLEVDGMPAFPE